MSTGRQEAKQQASHTQFNLSPVSGYTNVEPSPWPWAVAEAYECSSAHTSSRMTKLSFLRLKSATDSPESRPTAAQLAGAHARFKAVFPEFGDWPQGHVRRRAAHAPGHRLPQASSGRRTCHVDVWGLDGDVVGDGRCLVGRRRCLAHEGVGADTQRVERAEELGAGLGGIGTAALGTVVCQSGIGSCCPSECTQ